MLEVLDVVGKLGDEIVDQVAARALADDHETGVGKVTHDETPRRHETVDVLVRLEHADEEGGRLLRKRNDGVRSERGEVDVGNERGGHRDATDFLHEALREAGETAHGVPAAEGDPADGVRER